MSHGSSRGVLLILVIVSAALLLAHLWNVDRNEQWVLASCRGELADVRRLVDSGVDVNTTLGDIAWTPLECATSNRQFEVMQFLVQRGALSRKPGNFGTTALDQAEGDKRALDILKRTPDFYDSGPESAPPIRGK